LNTQHFYPAFLTWLRSESAESLVCRGAWTRAGGGGAGGTVEHCGGRNALRHQEDGHSQQERW